MIAGDTPFCFLAIPMMIVPAALSKTIIFPGSILPTPTNDKAIATMVALWLAATIVLGKGWCSYGCFFGGIEEGFAALRKRPLLRRIHPSLRLLPWGVLAAIVLLSAATYSPTYCEWLCPFKAVTEFPEVRSAQTAAQFGIFSALFAGLVIALPVATKKRTQCTFLCPFGAFQSLFNHISVFDIRVNRSACAGCTSLCTSSCPTLSIDKSSIEAGKTLISCMKLRRVRGRLPKGCRRVARERHTDWGATRNGPSSVSLRCVGVRHDVRWQHHRGVDPDALQFRGVKEDEDDANQMGTLLRGRVSHRCGDGADAVCPDGSVHARIRVAGPSRR